MSKSEYNVNLLIPLKCFIFFFGLFSLLLPWLYFPNYFEMNFLGIIHYTSTDKFEIIEELWLFFLCGLSYLIGLLCNFGFYEHKKRFNFYIGYVSLILIVCGATGYFLLSIFFMAITALSSRRVLFSFGLGIYLALITSLLIIIEFIYVKVKTSKKSKEIITSETVIAQNQSNPIMCPSCNSYNIDPTSQFCNKCGSPLN